jgi:putative nucleotidyltransferase with HDIG domain
MKKNTIQDKSSRLASRAMTAFGQMYQLAYASISPELIILNTSANFKSILEDQHAQIEGCLVTDILPELVGSEDALHLVLNHVLPALHIEMIQRKQSDGTFRFLNFHIYLLDEFITGSGLVFMAEDVTSLGLTAQKLIHQRNETRLLQQALARAYTELQTLATTDQKSAEEALHTANQELHEAYDRTMEGWVRALDLRDRETEGHTVRVAEITVRLARMFGIPESEITHIRRGALLHDIGKMGVPDRILLKEDKLTDEEWKVMRKHPNYAHEMLSPITYLHKAIDIPYCHHEKWDGSGYPRGLMGEEIPLAARMFALVDVWDALLSSRSYRKGWPHTRVIEYIRANSGSHFDPKIVEPFLRLAGELVHEI